MFVDAGLVYRISEETRYTIKINYHTSNLVDISVMMPFMFIYFLLKLDVATCLSLLPSSERPYK